MAAKIYRMPANGYTSSKPLKLPARDRTIEEVLDRVQGFKANAIAARSGVSSTTIRNWRKGKTRRPQHITMQFVLRSMGFDFFIGPLK